MGNVFNRYGAGGGKSEGIYIWKKYEYLQPLTVTNASFRLYAPSSTTWNFVDANFDVSRIPSAKGGTAVVIKPSNSPEELAVSNILTQFSRPSYETYIRFFVQNDYLYVQTTVNGDAISIWEVNTNAEQPTIVTGTSANGYSGPYTCSSITLPAKVGSLIGYVVSDDSSAYPDKAEQGGYWYEKYVPIDLAKLGCTKYETGQWTQTQRTYTNTVSHSLGIIPKFALVWLDGTQTSYATNVLYVFKTSDSGGYLAETYAGGTSGVTTGSGTATNTSATLITHSGSALYYFGIYTYKYILLA